MAEHSFHSSAATDAYEPFEVGEVHWLRREDDGPGSVPSGIWRITPEQLPPDSEYEVPRDETVYVIEGGIRFAVEGGPTFDLGPGGCASFVPGTRIKMTVLEPTKQFFVYS